MYAYSYVLENIDIDTNLEEGINKRLSLFTLYVFVFVFVLLLFFYLPFTRGKGKNTGAEQEKKSTF